MSEFQQFRDPVPASSAAPLQVQIQRGQTCKPQWNRAQITARRPKPDALISPPMCPAYFVELLLVQRMERVDYPKFPARAIILRCSLLCR